MSATPIAPEHAEKLRALSSRIAEFDRGCAEVEYTDLDAAWALLYDIRGALDAMTGSAT